MKSKVKHSRSEKRISNCVTVLIRLLAGLDVDRASRARYLPPNLIVASNGCCPFCGKIYRRKAHLVSHLNRAHLLELKHICRGD